MQDAKKCHLLLCSNILQCEQKVPSMYIVNDVYLSLCCADMCSQRPNCYYVFVQYIRPRSCWSAPKVSHIVPVLSWSGQVKSRRNQEKGLQGVHASTENMNQYYIHALLNVRINDVRDLHNRLHTQHLPNRKIKLTVPLNK